MCLWIFFIEVDFFLALWSPIVPFLAQNDILAIFDETIVMFFK